MKVDPVKSPHLRHGSLRTRFILGMGVMLLPMVVLAVGAFFSLQSAIRALDAVVREASKETAPILRLQNTIDGAANVIHDYLIAGDPGERARFLLASQSVDNAFEEAAAAPFALAEERALVSAARHEWQQARGVAQSILAVPRSGKDPTAMEDNLRWDVHTDRVMDPLNQVLKVNQQEMADDLALAYAVRRRALVVIATAFTLGLGAAILVATALARSVLLPLRVLEEGADRFGTGDLTHRVSLAKQDELGHLGGTFNAMAENLAKSQKALQELSTLDGLTGLYNYREFHGRLADEIQRSWRYDHPLSLLILDIDDFKAVNDTYGHLAGDEALRGLSALVRRAVRPVDDVARYGGEEFAIVLPETPRLGALAMAERIREIIATHPIAIAPAQTVGLSVSVGVATYPQDADSGEKLIDAADQALYAAKKGGRNRVCQWAGSPGGR